MCSIIKLVNGVEIVGKISEDTSSHIVLADPFQIHYKYFHATLPSVALVPYLLFADNALVTFKKSDILNVSTPRKIFVDFYNVTLDVFYNQITPSVDQELRQNVMSYKEQQENSTDNQQKRFLLEVDLEGRLLH